MSDDQKIFNKLVEMIKTSNESGYFWLELDQTPLIFNTKLNALFPNIFDSTVSIPVETARKFEPNAITNYGNFSGFDLMTVEECVAGFLTKTMDRNFYQRLGIKLTQVLAVRSGTENNFVMFDGIKTIYAFSSKSPSKKIVMYITRKMFPRVKFDPNIDSAETFLRNGLMPKKFNAKEKEAFKALAIKYHTKLIAIGDNGTLTLLTPVEKKEQKPVKPKPVEKKSVELNDEERALLDCDQRRFNYVAYEKDKLYDDGNGHWDIYDPAQANGANTYRTEKNFVARNPLLDVRRNGICAIDFGTKSTVVVCKDGSAQKQPLRIGTSTFALELDDKQYENPTVEEFVDMKKFMAAYDEQIKIGRPDTEWENFLVSYTAQGDMKVHSKNLQKYYSFFGELKQWASRALDDPIIIDQKGERLSVGNYVEPVSGELDLIELYAYYIGLNINNMKNGIWLKYKLSYPVSMKPVVASKIRESFERGLKKSLPVVLVGSDVMKKFRVELAASEPSAYAVCAMQEFELEPKEGQAIFYGVFDFGGGTTDFDFGLWLASDDDESDYGYEVHRLCNKGDEYLGGENLLKLMAYETFKKNAQELKKNDVCFHRPKFCEVFPGHEAVLSNTRAARKNMFELQEALRPFWEDERQTKNGDAQTDVEDKEIDLISDSKEGNVAVKIKIDYAALTEKLKKRIEAGIAQFEQRRQDALKMLDGRSDIDECMHIFLAGNSCRSKLVTEAFNEKYKDELANGKIKIHSPLEPREVSGRIFSPNGKTGVAWGLLDINDSVKFVDTELGRSGKAEFKYYVGIGRRGKFVPKIEPDVEYGAWQKAVKANKDTVTIYYSDNFEAGGKELSLNDASMKYILIDVDEPSDDKYIYIRAVDTDEIEYAIAEGIDGGGNAGQVVSSVKASAANDVVGVERRKLD